MKLKGNAFQTIILQLLEDKKINDNYGNENTNLVKAVEFIVLLLEFK